MQLGMNNYNYDDEDGGEYGQGSERSYGLDGVDEDFPIPLETNVVTSTYVTQELMPVLEIIRDEDPEQGDIWQFHCGNGDYSSDRLQLVPLGILLELDPALADVVVRVPPGCVAARDDVDSEWVMEENEEDDEEEEEYEEGEEEASGEEYEEEEE